MEKAEARKHFIGLIKNQKQKTIPDINIDRYSLVLTYIPMKTEVNCLPVIENALKSGKKVAIPTQDYRFFSILPDNRYDRLTKLDNGTLGLKDADLIEISQIWENTLVLVPGLAFTKDGIRLGRGSGFYDRVIAMLENNENIDIIGVCTQIQIADSLLFEPHDRKVKDLIIC